MMSARKFNRELFADFLLLCTAIIFGATFIGQKQAIPYVNAFTFNTLRFLSAALILLPIVAIRKSIFQTTNAAPPQKLKTITKQGMIAGSFLWGGITLQQIGLAYTSVGKAGFITGLYVILVPFIGILFGQNIKFTQIISAFLATAGLFLMSIRQSFIPEIGDTIVMISALFWALHILYLGKISNQTQAIRLAMHQYLYCGIFSAIAMCITLFITSGQGSTAEITVGFLRELYSVIPHIWIPVLFASLFSTVIGFSLQVYAQKFTPPSHTAIIISLEAVFAVLAGMIFLQERLSLRESTGAVLMFVAIILSQINKSPKKGLRK